MVLSCSTRSNLTCDAGGMLQTSSRKKVPPPAISNLPDFCLSAPVKAPFSYPNNSPSISVSGIAPQSTATNGPRARAEPVDGPRHQVLSRPGFSQNQNAEIRLATPRALGDQARDRLARTHRLAQRSRVLRLRGQPPQFALQPAFIQGAENHPHHRAEER